MGQVDKKNVQTAWHKHLSKQASFVSVPKASERFCRLSPKLKAIHIFSHAIHIPTLLLLRGAWGKSGCVLLRTWRICHSRWIRDVSNLNLERSQRRKHHIILYHGWCCIGILGVSKLGTSVSKCFKYKWIANEGFFANVPVGQQVSNPTPAISGWFPTACNSNCNIQQCNILPCLISLFSNAYTNHY